MSKTFDAFFLSLDGMRVFRLFLSLHLSKFQSKNKKKMKKKNPQLFPMRFGYESCVLDFLIFHSH